MTIDTSTTAGKIAVMQAYVEGKEVQVKSKGASNWHPVFTGGTANNEPVWAWDDNDYRIRPREPREFTVVVNDFRGPVSVLQGWEHKQSDYESGYTLVKVREVIE